MGLFGNKIRMLIAKTPEQVLREAEHLSNFATPTIHLSYQYFHSFFQNPLTPATIIQGAFMVYGWMPTMLRFKGPLDPLFELCFAAQKGTAEPDLILACAKTLNNSVVGTTKLMHFINPNIYPIWDSRVFRGLYQKNPHPYRVENPETYIVYKHWVQSFCLYPLFPTLHKRVQEEAGYEISGPRAAEACLYALGAKPKKTKVQT